MTKNFMCCSPIPSLNRSGNNFFCSPRKLGVWYSEREARGWYLLMMGCRMLHELGDPLVPLR